MAAEDKMLRKGRLSAAYGELDEELRLKLRAEFSALLKENSGLDAYMKQHMYYSILPAVSMYRVLQQEGYRKQEAYKLIRKSVLKTAEPTKKFIEKCSRLPFFFPLFRTVSRLSMNESFCGDEWKFIWKKKSGNSIEWECHSCIYFNRFSKYGMRELTTIFCESDDFVYSKLKNLRWGRTQTIGRGAEFCDFKFYREDKST